MLNTESTGPPEYFKDGSVTVYHGDCCEVLRALPSKTVDFVLTDPPYIVSYRGRWCSDWAPIAGDDESSWIVPAFSEIWRVLKKDALCFSFYGWPNADVFLSAWRLIGFRPVSQIVFVKDRIGLGCFTRGQHESAYLLAKGNPAAPDMASGDVFSWKRETSLFHPTQKPLGAISQIISAYTNEGDIVLDPFMGSGTTLVAARNLGRRAIGIEIEKQYCDVAVVRLAQEIFDFPTSRRTEQQSTLDLDHEGTSA